MDDEHKYDDIINLEHHVSKKHKQMSIQGRAAQFASFAALNGYEDAVSETARLTDDKIDIDDGITEFLDEQLAYIQSEIKSMPKVEITYFVSDNKKSGGSYQKIVGNVKKIDDYNKLIKLSNGIDILIKNILDICIIRIN